MGADFLLYAEPKCELTPERKARVMEMFRSMTEEEFGHAVDEHPAFDDFEKVEGEPFQVPEAAVKMFEESLDVYAGWFQGCPNDLTWWVAETYPIWITGGMSHGDEPTDSSETIDVLQAGPPGLGDLLEAWAREDYLRDTEFQGWVSREYAEIGAALAKAGAGP